MPMHCRLTLILFLTGSVLCDRAFSAPPPVPAASLAPLQAELVTLNDSRQSSTTKRRTCKHVIRGAQAWIAAHPRAPVRFQFFKLILKAQERLLAMENTQRNRDAFFKTCETLAQAPDAYIADRIKAELMLSERDLSARNADAKERIKALTAFVKRYRDTPGELQALMAAIRVAPQLGAYDFKNKLVKSLSQRFAGNATAIAFRRTLIGATRMDIVFSGTFQRVGGDPIAFPYDRLGHPYFAIFWSKDSSVSMAKIKLLKEQQDEHPGLFEIYSFNLDELPDAGQSILRGIGLACTVMKLPGGVRSDTFRSYALHVPTALRVNQFGHVIVPPSMAVRFKDEEEARKFAYASVYDDFAYPRVKSTNHIAGYDEYDRYLSQIQSILIGDLLVADAEPKPSGKPGTDAVDRQRLKSIRDCFAPAPYRYRLSKAEALTRYTEANKQCLQAITTHPKAPNLWRVRNNRVIALMGMANMSNSPGFLREAVKEANTILALNCPEEAMVTARFCLAKQALRSHQKSRATIVADFVNQCGGNQAGLRACAAAAILAIRADTRELYEQVRSRILASSNPPPELVPFVAFARSRFQQYYLFRGNPIFYLYSRIYRFAERNYMVNTGLNPMTCPMPAMRLKNVNGDVISFPETPSDRLTLMLFVEPPADGTTDLPGAIFTPAAEPTKRHKNPQPSGLLGNAYALAENHHNNGLRCVTIFISDDLKQIRAIRDRYNLPGLVTLLPGGLSNPIVNQLGILSADRHVNSFLVRRDATIAWRKSGIPYQMSGEIGYITTIGWEAHVNECDTKAGYRALKNKDYKKAVDLFTGTYLEKKSNHSQPPVTDDPLETRREWDGKWKSSRFHGRSLAYLALGDYGKALSDVDSAMSQHLRRGEFNHDPEQPCRSMIHMLTTKSKILDHLGRASEARTARNKAAVTPTDYPTDYSRVRGYNRPYEVFEDQLSEIAKEIK